MLRITRRSFGLAAAAGCAAPLFARRAAAAPDVVRLGLLSLTSHAPTIIAEARGYFREQGLDAQFTLFQAAQPMAVAIASGDVDFAVTAITGGLINLSEKGVIKVIGGALSETAEVSGEKILVSKSAFDSGVTSPAKLRGRSFGITTAGSSFQYMAHKIAQKEGFPEAELHLRALQDIPIIIAALKTGQIDAWAITPNVAETLTKTPSVVEIGKISDYIPGYQVTTVFTSTENMTKRLDLVKRFLAAYDKGVDDYNAAFVDKTATPEQTSEAVAMVHKYVYSDLPLEKADPAIRAGAMRINAKAKLNIGNVKDQVEWFKEQNMVPAGADVGRLVDARLVDSY